MEKPRSYFFCGIGGSGMLPLAMILHARGHRVQGSDRALDQGMTTEKFAWLRGQGIDLFPQDGSGLIAAGQILVTSTAVEDSVPDVATARRLGATEIRRAELLAEMFNAATVSIGIAGTSGKSTVTAMTGWLLNRGGLDPTVMNGAVMNNFAGAATPFASAVVGENDHFVSEIDESDGSIQHYWPQIAVLTNITQDHKTMDELRRLFGHFIADSPTVIANADDPEVMALVDGLKHRDRRHIVTFGIDNPATLVAHDIRPAPNGISFWVEDTASGPASVSSAEVRLQVPGRHNVANALAAIAVARDCGQRIESADALDSFTGLRRRMETVGTAQLNGGEVTVIDDFAHNPDKIAATLATLHDFPGRLLVMFQPHGFGPLRNMRQSFGVTFARDLRTEDVLLMPEPVYFGGTVDRDISSRDITEAIVARGRRAEAFDTRAECGDRLIELAQPGDRIVIMGARDDSLATFARDLVERLGQ
jgi:UDP-N-acetylmuramate--alanine ligase